MRLNKTSKRRPLLALVILAALAIFGCSSSVAGKYVSEKNPKNYLELKSDGTYFLQEGAMGVSGKYDVDGNQITLNTDMGLASRSTIEGKTLIDKDGERWTKQ